METKTRRGRWMDKMTTEERSEFMRQLVNKRHAKTTPEEKLEYALMMVKARTKDRAGRQTSTGV